MTGEKLLCDLDFVANHSDGLVSRTASAAAARLRELERERAHYESCHIAGHTCLRVAHENAAKRLRARAFLAAGWRRLAEKRAGNGEDAARKALDAVFAEAFDVDPMPTCATTSVYTMQENLRSFVRMACRHHGDAEALAAAVSELDTWWGRNVAPTPELTGIFTRICAALAEYEGKAGGWKRHCAQPGDCSSASSTESHDSAGVGRCRPVRSARAISRRQSRRSAALRAASIRGATSRRRSSAPRVSGMRS